MIRQLLFSFCLLLSLLLALAPLRLPPAAALGAPWMAPAPPNLQGSQAQVHPLVQPGPTIEPFVRPDLARRLERLRPLILAAAKRHNRPELSGMDDESFAVVIALIIYNENFGWLEDDVPPLRILTPLYQRLQQMANQCLPGSNFSVWPVNLRPSVALEILKQQLPLADGRMIHVPVRVAGSRIDPATYARPADLLAAINAEISRDDLAIAYLAANLERGLYRAALEGAPVTWQTLAAWHNQGIVDPRAIRANPTARDYVRRAAAFLPLAQTLITASARGQGLSEGVSQRRAKTRQVQQGGVPMAPATPTRLVVCHALHGAQALQHFPLELARINPGEVVRLDHRRWHIVAGSHTVEFDQADILGMRGGEALERRQKGGPASRALAAKNQVKGHGHKPFKTPEALPIPLARGTPFLFDHATLAAGSRRLPSVHGSTRGCKTCAKAFQVIRRLRRTLPEGECVGREGPGELPRPHPWHTSTSLNRSVWEGGAIADPGTPARCRPGAAGRPRPSQRPSFPTC